ncbi:MULTISPECIES: tRNA glutamyl-Q(34) synthetase GluQRS [unclassified Brevundimonas]|uniref:tRNA glutamyl-Q(34) synthetase GluQRS n=1 Tax=unclassified Brevundimonas TaxID=2622653 RepID=UPI000CFBD3AF|nr:MULTISPECIES: tRNA glutamyl-Q(34) synthetase GluQRS [unclassified Brevundimonas]PRA25999.1 tRNA glutamyl-Q(34) synthetase GluQRS [Brevundimonas sp. MYb27]PQZ77447.1 tRNA glutamyl-Q(34) synthetase GluQRS [Brevundimonas sp. MYb31]PRB13178.1 tRNA glutamyl-Q(34) synthetase GluQRS [Brevundimonas sp. MYb52]PRB33804.1 tRNA glutamyl-Q(34) synthetase GluQRS [Brevundimonas sp. MYb46]PRB44549.1 tRNA glutamyl-Q(34) synthetase GluQRS [Brevundimonas sp. MYb33]
MFATRFAPSPTGRLHRGHAFSALTAWSAAREAGGRFVLRIEDIDPTRCKPEYEAAILEDLTWLGLDWEVPVRRQSDHLADYAAVIDTLNARGLLYRCFRTRKDILDAIGDAPHGPAEAVRPGPHAPDEEVRLLAEGRPYAWRLSLDRARAALSDDAWNALAFVEEGVGPDGETGVIRVRPETAGDVVLARKDAGTAYHLAVTHDDALQGITHVVRGLDLFEATHIQRLIQTLMGWPAPVYRHHRLLTGPDGRRYAKRDQSVTLAELRAGGLTPEALRAELGF